MYPVILEIGDFVISSYGLMMVIAFILGNYLLRKDMIRLGKDPLIADDLTFRAAIGGILGAKIYYLIENIPGGRAIENLGGLSDIAVGIFTLDGSLIAAGIQNFGSGMVFLGGLFGGMMAVTLYARREKIKWKDIADWTAPYVVLGHGIGRIGCFLVGDDYGKATDLPWGIAFPNGLPPVHFPVHPTQLYEMSAYMLIFIYLRFIRHSQQYAGQIIYEYLFLGGFARFVIEFIRVNPKIAFNLSSAQVISILMMIVSIYLMYNERQKISATG